jgi:hypothetical protein
MTSQHDEHYLTRSKWRWAVGVLIVVVAMAGTYVVLRLYENVFP